MWTTLFYGIRQINRREGYGMTGGKFSWFYRFESLGQIDSVVASNFTKAKKNIILVLLRFQIGSFGKIFSVRY